MKLVTSNFSVKHTHMHTHTATVSWKPWKAGSVIRCESEAMRNIGVNGRNPSPKAGDEMRCPSLTSEAGRKRQILPSCIFCSIQASTDGMMLRHTGGGDPLYCVH